MVIYVGNLSVEAGERDLLALFEQHGQVTSVNVMRDEVSGNMLGFAFVEMPDESAAHRAIEDLNRTRIAGRAVMVCEAPRRTERRRSARTSSAPTGRK